MKNIIRERRIKSERPRSTAGAPADAEIRANAGEPDQEEIRRAAYECWMERGCPEGDAEKDWYSAEQRLRGKR